MKSKNDIKYFRIYETSNQGGMGSVIPAATELRDFI